MAKKNKSAARNNATARSLKLGIGLFVPLILVLSVIPLIVQMQLVPLPAEVRDVLDAGFCG